MTGRIVSCGGDGNIFVYEEAQSSETKGKTPMQGTHFDGDAPSTTWHVIAQIGGAHDDYEINHVCWARRQDRGKHKEDEEVILSTGDDGVVRVWTIS